MRRTTFAVLGGCILLSSTMGCRRLKEAYEESKSGSTSISMATVRRPDGVANGEAEKMIAVARCSREAACAKIRRRDLRTSRDQCERDVAVRLHRDLSAPSCGATIGREALEECLGELGAEDCNGNFDGIARIAACQPKTLCSQ
jgi:hypothetical protein